MNFHCGSCEAITDWADRSGEVVIKNGMYMQQCKTCHELAKAPLMGSKPTGDVVETLAGMNIATKARVYLVLGRLARELQGKAILDVPRFQIVFLFKTALEEINYPADQLEAAVEKLVDKFLDFIR